MFPKWPLKLKSEPRLWGAVVLDHPKNPPSMRGKGFAMSSIGGINQAGAWVGDGNGGPMLVDGRGVFLTFPTTRGLSLMSKARKRWLEQHRLNGTLDIVCGCPGDPRKGSDFETVFMSVMMVVLVVLVVIAFVVPVIRMHPSQRSWVDWTVSIGACAFMLLLPTVAVCVVRQSKKLTCHGYRLTSMAITPLDGEQAGNVVRFADVIDFGDAGMARLLRLDLPGRSLRIVRPPIPAAKLLGREQDEKLRNRNLIRRIAGVLIAGAVLAAFVGYLTQPITGMPAWRPALALLSIVPGGLLAFFGQAWMLRGFAALERRSKQRKNRHAAASGHLR